uniref:Uncharacterized protein n=1 Tax=Chromera velia CCMP2878 TaxID=1169474 RepID=A0A0G4GNR7_9ALVE|eukprot:Cvel_22698.t1-p1 / transcript=Cvel_22698.t1 / gene=Cvel_22698 / organism=Chromera_velia_CCMP2878 / gene_product=hypothetical protein / transcript_product=hypothetical protein / location=Cvel_scaffold2261:5237-6631(+) / protein_length=359 / sequence_SO=supercontig / SO=protein_coding / is_pseudo=false
MQNEEEPGVKVCFAEYPNDLADDALETLETLKVFVIPKFEQTPPPLPQKRFCRLQKLKSLELGGPGEDNVQLLKFWGESGLVFPRVEKLTWMVGPKGVTPLCPDLFASFKLSVLFPSLSSLEITFLNTSLETSPQMLPVFEGLDLKRLVTDSKEDSVTILGIQRRRRKHRLTPERIAQSPELSSLSKGWVHKWKNLVKLNIPINHPNQIPFLSSLAKLTELRCFGTLEFKKTPWDEAERGKKLWRLGDEAREEGKDSFTYTEKCYSGSFWWKLKEHLAFYKKVKKRGFDHFRIIRHDDPEVAMVRGGILATPLLDWNEARTGNGFNYPKVNVLFIEYGGDYCFSLGFSRESHRDPLHKA